MADVACRVGTRRVGVAVKAVGVLSLLAAAWCAALFLRTTWGWIQPHGSVVSFYRGVGFEHLRWRSVQRSMSFYSAGRPAPFVPRERFSARWSATLEVPVSTNYEFATLSQDGVRLFIDGKLIIDNWRTQGFYRSGRNAALWLDRGPHAFTVEHFSVSGHSRLRVEWCGGPVPPRTTVGGQYLFKRLGGPP